MTVPAHCKRGVGHQSSPPMSGTDWELVGKPTLLVMVKGEFSMPFGNLAGWSRSPSGGRGLLERATVLQICGNARGSEAMVANLRLDAGRRGAPPDHGVGVGLGQGSAGEFARAAADGSKQRSLEVCGEA